MASRAEQSGGPLKIGDRFLKYEIVALLGKGGQGYVYEGLDAYLERRVAIKLMPHPREPERARQEALALLRLSHPNIVQLIDGGLDADGAIYLIMERLEGCSLRSALQCYRRFTIAETLLVATEVTRALEAAHRAKVIHRDIKPENIFIQPGNRLKVLDFGIAKLVDNASLTTQQQQRAPGTLSYMSPEQLQGLVVTERSDLYALGTTLYEALAGIHPCVIGTHDLTQQGLLGVQLMRDPPRLDQLDPRIPAAFADLIHRLLAKKPAQRPASAEAVSSALETFKSQYERESGTSPLRDLWLPVSGPDTDRLQLPVSGDLTSIQERAVFLLRSTEASATPGSGQEQANALHSEPFVETSPPLQLEPEPMRVRSQTSADPSERAPRERGRRIRNGLLLAGGLGLALGMALAVTKSMRSAAPELPPSSGATNGAPEARTAPVERSGSSVGAESGREQSETPAPADSSAETSDAGLPLRSEPQSSRALAKFAASRAHVSSAASSSAKPPNTEASQKEPAAPSAAPARGPDPIFGERK